MLTINLLQFNVYIFITTRYTILVTLALAWRCLVKKVLALLVLVLIGCSTQNTGVRPIYVYGDSIDKGGIPGDSYGDIISSQFGWYEVNLAIGGTELTSPNQYPSIMYDCCAAGMWAQNSFVFYKPGVNDSGINGNDPAYEATYLGDLINMIQYVAKYTPTVTFFLGTPTQHCQTGPLTLGDNTNVDLYAALNRQAVQTVNAPNVKLIEFNQTWAPTTNNTIDCLHPNVQGYTELANIFLAQTQGLNL